MSEKTIYAICLTVFIAFAGFFIAYGYFIPQICDIDKQYWYCHLHPNGAFSIIGQIMLGAALVFISGVWKIFTGELITNKAGAYAFLGFVCGAIGVGLIFAQ